jgi:hybrid cluster-associated redox disulfide protein
MDANQATGREVMDNQFKPETIVAELLAEHPEAIPVFTRHRMGCVGCTMSCYETLGSAAEIYRLSLTGFLDELRMAVNVPAQTPKTSQPNTRPGASVQR